MSRSAAKYVAPNYVKIHTNSTEGQQDHSRSEEQIKFIVRVSTIEEHLERFATNHGTAFLRITNMAIFTYTVDYLYKCDKNMEIIERGSYWVKVIHLFYAKTHGTRQRTEKPYMQDPPSDTGGKQLLHIS